MSGYSDEERIKASPAARRLARQLGVDITRIKGTGPDGRVQLSDVESFSETPEDDRFDISDVREGLLNEEDSLEFDTEEEFEKISLGESDMKEIPSADEEPVLSEADIFRRVDFAKPREAEPAAAVSAKKGRFDSSVFFDDIEEEPEEAIPAAAEPEFTAPVMPEAEILKRSDFIFREAPKEEQVHEAPLAEMLNEAMNSGPEAEETEKEPQAELFARQDILKEAPAEPKITSFAAYNSLRREPGAEEPAEEKKQEEEKAKQEEEEKKNRFKSELIDAEEEFDEEEDNLFFDDDEDEEAFLSEEPEEEEVCCGECFVVAEPLRISFTVSSAAAKNAASEAEATLTDALVKLCALTLAETDNNMPYDGAVNLVSLEKDGVKESTAYAAEDSALDEAEYFDANEDEYVAFRIWDITGFGFDSFDKFDADTLNIFVLSRNDKVRVLGVCDEYLADIGTFARFMDRFKRRIMHADFSLPVE